jgi:hypothetical protein
MWEVGFSEESILRLVLLVLYVSLAAMRPAWARLRRADAIVLSLMVAVCLVSYLGSVRFNPNARRIHIHHWDVYHYFIGTKYFAELGYRDLYRATAIADFEDDRANFRPDLLIRDLRNNVDQIPRSTALEDRTRIKTRFAEPGRWREFKDDIAFFRSADRKLWRASKFQQDHGYNGAPLTTALLGFLANQRLVDTSTFLRFIVWADLALVLLLALVIARAHGATLGLTFLFFWFVNPFNDYDYLGGSFLRYNHFLAAALGIALYHSGKPIASGASFALATLFRIFPFFFVAGLVAGDLLRPNRKSLLRANRSFYLSYAATAALILAATSALRTPDAQVGWLAFFERITQHASVQAHNVIGLKCPFMYSHEHNLEEVIASQQEGETGDWELEWSAQRDELYREREPLYLGAVAVLLGLAIPYLRRSRREEALFLGIFGAFLPLLLAHYYYCMLALIPLIFPDDRRIWSLLGLFMIPITATSSLGPLAKIPDLAYLVYSLEVLALLLGVVLLKVWSPRPRAAGWRA